jgi:hypothetical protein
MGPDGKSGRIGTGAGIARRGMVRAGIVLAIVFVLAVVGGCLYLAYGDFSAPSKPVEKVLPDARFPK